MMLISSSEGLDRDAYEHDYIYALLTSKRLRISTISPLVY